MCIDVTCAYFAHINWVFSIRIVYIIPLLLPIMPFPKYAQRNSLLCFCKVPTLLRAEKMLPILFDFLIFLIFSFGSYVQHENTFEYLEKTCFHLIVTWLKSLLTGSLSKNVRVFSLINNSFQKDIWKLSLIPSQLQQRMVKGVDMLCQFVNFKFKLSWWITYRVPKWYTITLVTHRSQNLSYYAQILPA